MIENNKYISAAYPQVKLEIQLRRLEAVSTVVCGTSLLVRTPSECQCFLFTHRFFINLLTPTHSNHRNIHRPLSK